MRSRCSSCYNTKYKGEYSAISYKWSHSKRTDGVQVSVCNEAGENIGWEWIPTVSKKMVDVTLANPLFFLDTLNTKRGDRDDWSLGNVYSTYSDCKNVLCFENPSDRRVNGEPLHPGGDRHRGASLQSNYCSSERWIANSERLPLIFYNGSGGTTTNLDRLGSRDGSNPDGTFQHRNLLTQGNTKFLTPDMTEKQRRKQMRILKKNPSMMGEHLEELLSGEGLFGYSNLSMGTPNSTFSQPPTLSPYTDPLNSMFPPSFTVNPYTDGSGLTLNQPHTPSPYMNYYGSMPPPLNSYGLYPQS